MGVYFCSAYICMAQENLDKTQVCAAFQQMGGKTMSQGVRGYASFYARLPGIAFDHFPDTLSGQSLS